MSPGMSQATLNTIKYDDKKRELNQDAAASPSKKAPKNPAVKPAHPPYAVMIAEAIRALKERTGSSRHAILKYILANYKVADADKAQVRAKLAIRKMLEAKTLIPVKGSFILPKDEPVKTKPKITEQKADIVKKDLSDYEKMVQANIAERMKLLESLGVFDDRDELKALQQKPRKPTKHIKIDYHSLPSPINSHKRKLVTSEKRERPILTSTRRPAGPAPIEEYYTKPDIEEFQTFLCGLQSLSISSKSESIWNRSKEEVLETMKKMKNTKENVTRVVPQTTFSLAVHPTKDKILLLAGDNGGNLGLWNVTAKEDRDTHFFLPHNKVINRITIHPNNQNQIYTTSEDGSVRYTDLRSSTVCEVYNTSVAQSREDYILWHDHFAENFLMVTTSYGTAEKIDLRDPGKAVVKYHGHNGWSIDCVTCHPLHTQYFATSSADGYVHLWDMRNHKENDPVASHLHDGRLYGIDFSPLTGKQLLSTCQDNYVRFLSTDFTKFKVDKEIHHNNAKKSAMELKFKPCWLPGQENLVALGSIGHPKGIAIMNSLGDIVHNFMSKLLTTSTFYHVFHPTLPVAVGAKRCHLHVFSHV